MARSFVIQQHAASTLHFDFRLEVGGVLRSWAVPKGPSADPSEKRLAIQVDDHPVSWGRFEGRIGAGYGKGSVIVWDRGTYENASARDGEPVGLEDALEDGHARIDLHGEKVRGGYVLQRFGDEDKPLWLLIKTSDDDARPGSDLVADSPASVLSGKTIDEL